MTPTGGGAPVTWWGAMMRRTWLRSLVIAGGASVVLFLVAEAVERLPAGPTEYGAAALVALGTFVLYGFLWRGPLATAGLTWLGVEAGLLLVGVVTGPGEPGWGALLIYATEAGFVSAFGTFVGSWVRTAMATRPRARAGAPEEPERP